jgi:thiol-disulfide isomerase/thioredoxin
MKAIILSIAATFFMTAAMAQYTNTKIVVGEPAPELELKTPDGKDAKLSSLIKDKVVLLDFWASWCGPCRASNPEVVKTYNEYKGKKFKGAKKGFTVVNVSLDQNEAQWKAAIEKDGLVWNGHLSDLKGWGSEAAKVYGVAFVPQCFLVDGSGAIIGKYNHAGEALQDLQKLLK